MYGLSDAMLLIALGMGYFVLYFALKEQKKLRLIGLFVGAMIMGLAVGHILLNLCPYSPVRCPLMGKYYKNKRCSVSSMQAPMIQPWLPKALPGHK